MSLFLALAVLGLGLPFAKGDISNELDPMVPVDAMATVTDESAGVDPAVAPAGDAVKAPKATKTEKKVEKKAKKSKKTSQKKSSKSSSSKAKKKSNSKKSKKISQGS